MNRSANGRAGEVQGLVMAEVVDNVDPEEKGRIMVKFVTMHNQPKTKWVYQIAPMAGKERGFYTLPEVGDKVIVGFMGDDDDEAVVIGAVWNGKQIPPTEAKDTLPGPDKTDTGATWSTDTFTDGSKDLEKNDRRFWKSRSGHLIVFDDTESAETVQIWDKEHILSISFDSKEKRIFIANTEGDVHIRAKENLFLETTNGDVKIRAGKNLVTESVQDTTQTTKGNWQVDTTGTAKLSSTQATTVTGKTGATVTSDAATSVEGKVKTDVKGGMVTVNGDSAVSIGGAIIKLN